MHEDCVISLRLLWMTPASFLTRVLESLKSKQLKLFCSICQQHTLRVVAEPLRYVQEFIAVLLQRPLKFRSIVDFLQTQQIRIVLQDSLQLG